VTEALTGAAAGVESLPSWELPLTEKLQNPPPKHQDIKRQVLTEGALQPVINLLSSPCAESQREAALLLGQFATTDNGEWRTAAAAVRGVWRAGVHLHLFNPLIPQAQVLRCDRSMSASALHPVRLATPPLAHRHTHEKPQKTTPPPQPSKRASRSAAPYRR
jgi:hypothetical protein